MTNDLLGGEGKDDGVDWGDWRSLPVPPIEDWSRPEDYFVDPKLEHAVRTAVRLGLPLLLTGDPGSGKTELANYLAWRLGTSIGRKNSGGELVSEHALRFDIKSDTRARDLFYSIDLVERFHAGKSGASTDELNPLNFIRFNALGRALLYARAPDELTERLLPWQSYPERGAQRSVVLIDEIDKAPSDVPNDLLMEIDKMQFYIAELSRVVAAPPSLRPIVIITSNTEQKLPDAFLRRCAYFHIDFPERDRLIEIVSAKLKATDQSLFIVDSVDAFLNIRKQPLRKKPATAELLAFVQALRDLGFELGDRLTDPARWEQAATVTLLKTREDRGRSIPPFVPSMIS